MEGGNVLRNRGISRNITMKKILVAIAFCFTFALFMSNGLFGAWVENFKRAACERSCVEVYNKCMESTGKAVDREEQGNFEGDLKYEAKNAYCQEKKDKCMTRCE
jgi:hypothetical protein